EPGPRRRSRARYIDAPLLGPIDPGDYAWKHAGVDGVAREREQCQVSLAQRTPRQPPQRLQMRMPRPNQHHLLGDGLMRLRTSREHRDRPKTSNQTLFVICLTERTPQIVVNAIGRRGKLILPEHVAPPMTSWCDSFYWSKGAAALSIDTIWTSRQ